MSNFFTRSLDRFGSAYFNHLNKRANKYSYKQIEKRAKFYSNLYCMIDKRRVETARNNMKLAFGDKYTDSEINPMVKEVIYNFLVEFYMFFRSANISKDEIFKIVELKNSEYIKEAINKDKGVIYLTAHFGNWELMARRLSAEFIKINVIARDSDHVGMTEITNNIRNSGGYDVYSKDQPLFGIIKALKRKEALGILPDQGNEEGIWVKFFNRDAKTATGTAMFSLKTGAPIVPVFCYRNEIGKYTLEVYPIIDYTPIGNKEVDTKNLTQICNDVIEKAIREHPTSWLWIHDRWKKYEDD